LCYFFYFGIGVGVTWQLMRRGLTRGQLWALFVAGIVGDFVLEATLLHFDTYMYYGWQPLVVLKFPLWWGPVNSLITMIAGAVILRFERVFTNGWRQLLVIPVARGKYHRRLAVVVRHQHRRGVLVDPGGGACDIRFVRMVHVDGN
jgi:hypothetical protein